MSDKQLNRDIHKCAIEERFTEGNLNNEFVEVLEYMRGSNVSHDLFSEQTKKWTDDFEVLSDN